MRSPGKGCMKRHGRKYGEPVERMYEEVFKEVRGAWGEAAEDVGGCIGGSMRAEEPGERVDEEPG